MVGVWAEAEGLAGMGQGQAVFTHFVEQISAEH